MMEHIYPAFERGRIMKKELLWALRDYAYSALQIKYQNYADGILSGCGIHPEGSTLRIAPGMIKCADFIFLITGEERVSYTPTGEYISLKFRLKEKEDLPDYTRYLTEFALDDCMERSSNEIELCRFKLKEGAVLRTEYKDFYDIQTEYDTVNLADATWSCAGHNTLSKDITDYFAQKVLECEKAEEQDIQFAYFLLRGQEAADYRILTDYIRRKTGESVRDAKEISAEEAFDKLVDILDGIRRGTGTYRNNGSGAERRMIVWE
ncbi:MAG: hypothetical protein K2L86_10445 [Lachnospiraceae bacterium]|nr:hypothetical protein [Lachnospiraceae bacterium]